MTFDVELDLNNRNFEANFKNAIPVGGSVDQTFNPESEKAQSGKAVAEAIANKADKSQIGDIETALDNKVDKEEGKTLYRGMELIYEHTITENNATVENLKITLDINENAFKLDEIYVHINANTGIPAALSNPISIICNNSGNAANYLSTSNMGKGTKHIQSYAKRVKQNKWFTLWQPPTSAMYGNSFNGSYAMTAVDYITWVYISNINQLPIGTTITVCGRRAD